MTDKLTRASNVLKEFILSLSPDEQDNLRYHLEVGTLIVSSTKIFDKGGA